jgi:hypothetical protein
MIHREMGLGGWDGSFWSRGDGFPSGKSSALFVPQPEADSARATMTRRRRIMKFLAPVSPQIVTSPTRRQQGSRASAPS